MNTDCIKKTIVLQSTKHRVWQALTDSSEFGHWFGVKLEGPFSPGVKVRGLFSPTKVDARVAELQKPHEGTACDFLVESLLPERLFSFRWHPYAIEENVDYSQEPTTLVTFELEQVEAGVLLTVTESGFDRIPLARRAQAFASNEGGWSIQVTLIDKYLRNGE